MHFPKSCLHCDDAPCVTVCPTGASYKRAEDGIVLVNEDACMGCGLCAWACPYGAREMDAAEGVMKKCTLCVDRIYNEHISRDRPRAGLRPHLPGACARHFGDLGDPESDVSIMVAARGGYDLMPEMATKPVNKYLPPRPKAGGAASMEVSSGVDIHALAQSAVQSGSHARPGGMLGWLDRALATLD